MRLAVVKLSRVPVQTIKPDLWSDVVCPAGHPTLEVGWPTTLNHRVYRKHFSLLVQDSFVSNLLRIIQTMKPRKKKKKGVWFNCVWFQFQYWRFGSMVTWVFSMQSQFVTLVTSICTVLIGSCACGGGMGVNCTTHCLDNSHCSADPHSLQCSMVWSLGLSFLSTPGKEKKKGVFEEAADSIESKLTLEKKRFPGLSMPDNPERVQKLLEEEYHESEDVRVAKEALSEVWPCYLI